MSGQFDSRTQRTPKAIPLEVRTQWKVETQSRRKEKKKGVGDGQRSKRQLATSSLLAHYKHRKVIYARDIQTNPLTVLHTETSISWRCSEIHFGDGRKYEIVARGCCWESSSRLSDNSGRSSSWGGGEHYPPWRRRAPLSWRRRAPLSWRGRQLSSLLESKRWISPQAASKMLLIIKVKASWWWLFFGWSAGDFASIHMVISKQYVHHCYNDTRWNFLQVKR